MEVLRVVFVPALRTLFRGASLGLEEEMAKVLKGLSHDLRFVLTAEGAVRSVGDASAVARKLAHEKPDLLVLGVATFVTGELLGPLLELPLPKVLWSPPEAWLGDALPQNALCGLSLACSLPKARPPLRWLYGPPREKEVGRLLEPTLRAVRALKVLQGAKLLWIGGPAPGFDAFWERPTTGASVEAIPLEELFALYETVPGDRVREVLEAWPEVRAWGEEGQKLVRLAVALQNLAQGYDGLALRDWPEIPEHLGVVPSASLAYLGDLGVVVAPEGDLMGLLSQLVLKALGGRDPILLDIVAAEEEALLLWHGGEAPLSWAGGSARLIPHFNRGLPAVRDMILRAGPVTGLRVTSRGLVVLEGWLDGRGGYLGVSGWLRELRWAGKRANGRECLSHWLNGRVPHHLALAQGNLGEAALELALWSGLGVIRREDRVWGGYWQ